MTYVNRRSSNINFSIADIANETDFRKQKKSDRNPNRGICSKSLSRNPIPWTPDKMLKIREFFEGKNPPYRFYDFSTTYEVFGKEIQIFAASLDAYIEEGGLISHEDLIFFSSSGPEYTDVLKEFRQDCFLYTIDAVSFKKKKQPQYELYNLKVQKLKNIDQIFPYRFCIFWEEKCDNSEFYEIELKTNHSVIEEFKTCLGFIFSSLDERSYDPRFEILTEISTSKSIINGEKGIHMFRPYRGKEVENYFSTSISKVTRSIIPVYPGGYRDSVICSPESLSTIKLIEKVTCDFLKDIPCHLYLDKPDDIFRAVDKHVRLTETLRTFLCRDIKKEGLTKPRYLLKLMIQEMSKLNPILEPYINFYDSFDIEGIKAIRGHGLGMANALTTLLQCVISLMIKNRLENKGFESDLIDFFVFNDDFLAIMPDDFRDEYWEEEGEIFEGLGLIRNEEKSFWSLIGAVFCENYSYNPEPDFSRKKVSLRRTVYLTFCFDYIHEAKEFYVSLGPEYRQLHDDTFEQITRFWGYEFFKEEIRYPYQMGGWISYSFEGYNIDFSIFEFEDYNPNVYAAYKACKFKGRINRKSDIGKKSVFLNKLLPFEDSLGDCLPLGDDCKLKNKYHVYQLADRTGFNFRKFISKRRIEIFRETQMKCRMPFSEFKKEFFLDKKNILPKKDLEWLLPDLYVQPIGDVYQQKTPIRNFLLSRGFLFSSDTSENLPEEYSILNFKVKTKNPDLTKEFVLPNFSSCENMENLGINKSQFYQDDREIRDLGNLLYIVQKLYNDDFYPVLDSRYRDPDIERKKLQIYGRLLTIEEQIQISTGEMPQNERRFIERFRQWLEKARPEGLSDDEADEIIIQIQNLNKRFDDQEDEGDLSPDEEPEDEEEIARMQELIQKYQRPKNDSKPLKSFEDFLENNLWRAIFETESWDEYEDLVRKMALTFKGIYEWAYGRVELVPEFHKQKIQGILDGLNQSEKDSLFKLAEKLIIRDGYCKDMSEIFGFEEPEEDFDCGDMFGAD